MRLKNCEECGKPFNLFRWRHQCEKCKRTLCSACLRELPITEWLAWNPFNFEGRLCSNCWTKIAAPIEKRYAHAVNIASTVKIFSENYKGRVPIVENSAKSVIETEFFRNKSDAEWMLRVSAAYLGCNVIYQTVWHKKTLSQSTGRNGRGTYYYSVWQATGIPAIRKGK